MDECHPVDVDHFSSIRGTLMAHYGQASSNTGWIHFKYKPFGGMSLMHWSVIMNVVGSIGDRITVQWRSCTTGPWNSWETVADFWIAGGVPGSNRVGRWKSNGFKSIRQNDIMNGMGPKPLSYIAGHVYEFRYRINSIGSGTGKVKAIIQRGW